MTTKNHLKKLSSISLALFALGIMTVSALTVSPARDEKAADPGETIQGTMTIINEQDADQTYYTSVENFDSQGESGTPNFTASKEGLASWVKVEEKITLKRNERISLPYSITVPKDAEAGGHFAAIFLSTVPPAAGEGQVSVGAKVGMLILLRVTGDVKETGNLLTFAIKNTEGKTLTSLPIEFFYRFKNTGNDRVEPKGDIVIKNMIGGEVARINANKSQGNVLPASTRRFDVRYGENDAPAVSAPFFDKVRFQMDNFAFGMYTANLDLAFGNQGKDSKTLTYFILPWHLITVVVVTILVVVLLLTLMLKQYNKWIIKQARAAAKK